MSARNPMKWLSRPSTFPFSVCDLLAERVDALAHPGHLGGHLGDVIVQLDQVVADLGQHLDRLGDHAKLGQQSLPCHAMKRRGSASVWRYMDLEQGASSLEPMHPCSSERSERAPSALPGRRSPPAPRPARLGPPSSGSRSPAARAAAPPRARATRPAASSRLARAAACRAGSRRASGRRSRRRAPARLGERVVGDAGAEPDPDRLGAVEHPRRQHELLGDVEADQPGQRAGDAHVGDQAPVDLADRDARVGCDEPDVGAERDLGAAADAVAVDRADHRDRQGLPAVGDPLGEVGVLAVAAVEDRRRSDGPRP